MKKRNINKQNKNINKIQVNCKGNEMKSINKILMKASKFSSNFTPAKLNHQPQSLAPFSSWSLVFYLCTWTLN